MKPGRPRMRPGATGRRWYTAHGPLQEGRRERLPEGTKPPRGGLVTARVKYRTPTGELKELARSAATMGAADAALDAALTDLLAARPAGVPGVSWGMTVEELAERWLEHRRAHGLARRPGALRPSTLAQMEATIRTVILGRRRVRTAGGWQEVSAGPGLGALMVHELTLETLGAWLAELEAAGRSTKQARAVLSQMLNYAVREGLAQGNPMGALPPPRRETAGAVPLGVPAARRVRDLVRAEYEKGQGYESGRRPNLDLCDLVDILLGTGARIGEALAVRWLDLDLDAPVPYVLVRGTLVEERGGVGAYRSPRRKSDARNPETLERARRLDEVPDLTLFLPGHVVELLRARWSRLVDGGRAPSLDETVLATATGAPLRPSNMRTRLRKALAGDEDLAGVSPHSFRKTVATLVERELGMDAARHQMGHADTTTTGRAYVADEMTGPDARAVLGQFFTDDWAPKRRAPMPRGGVRPPDVPGV